MAKKTPAPDGEHQVVLKDSEGNDVKIRVISKDGKIVERENVEEKPEQEMEDEKMTEIAELFKKALEKFENKLDKMESRFSTLETKFNKFSKEPAGEKVYTQKTINEEIPSSSKLDGYRRLVEILSQK